MKKVILIMAIAGSVISCRQPQEKTAGAEASTEVIKTTTTEPVRRTVPVASRPAVQQTTTTEKKGMSKAAKGAIIGGVGGAVVGGVATKSAKGAVVGGVVGAAGGYIIGRSKDKKDGRVTNQ